MRLRVLGSQNFLDAVTSLLEEVEPRPEVVGEATREVDCLVVEAGFLRDPVPQPAVVVGAGGIALQELTGPWLVRAAAWSAERHAVSDRLQASERRAAEMLATVSHELRSPMTVISMAVQLAQNPSTTPEKRARHLNLLGQSVQSLHTLLNDILDYSKLDSGRLELSHVDFDLRALLENVAEGYRLLAERKGLEFRLELPDGLVDGFKGDPGRLRQILVNLLGNALKFTKTGSVGLLVEELARSESTSELQVAVRDSGIGIPEDAQARIFQAYEQADKNTSRKFGGTGLGLAITRRLVQMMGGRIWVESAPGLGSTFRFTCRLEHQPEAAALRLARVELRGKKILVADHNQASREQTLKTAEALGMTCTSATTASEAAKVLVSGSDFELMLLDLDLGRSSGFDLLAQLQQDGHLERMVVLITTSAGQRGDGARCVELGGSAYLTRPLTAQDLRDAMEAALADHRAGRKRLITRYTLQEQRSDSGGSEQPRP